MKQASAYRAFFVFPAIFVFAFSPFSSSAVTPEEIAQKNREIEEIQRQIEQYQQQINTARSQAATLQSEVAGLNAQISQITLAIKSLGLSISRTNLEIQSTQGKIKEAEDKIGKDQVILGQYLRVLHQNDQESLTTILLKNDTLSDFFNNLNSLKTTQDDLKVTITGMKELKASLEVQRAELEEKKDELLQQQRLEQLEKRDLDQIKAKKDKLLKDTKGQESRYQQLVKQGQSNIDKIKAEIFYLQQNGISADDAVKYATLAAISTGIRPAFLLAEMEIESGLGSNVGKCNRAGDPPSRSYRVVMKPDRDIKPFLAITASLGLDPETTPVSCALSIGWGGAMGPAQFIPSTWMGYKDEVARIVGRPVANPWNIHDAFTAAAIKLARGGATSQTKAGEIAASKAYYCGNSKSTRSDCVNYANKVQRMATQLEQNL